MGPVGARDGVVLRGGVEPLSGIVLRTTFTRDILCEFLPL